MPPQNRTTSSSAPFGASQINNSTSSALQIEAAWASFESMIEKRLEEIKPKTPAQIKANGDSRNKTIVITGLVVILGMILLFAGITWIMKSETGKEFTSSLMPVVTAIISGVFGYLSGEKNAK